MRSLGLVFKAVWVLLNLLVACNGVCPTLCQYYYDIINYAQGCSGTTCTKCDSRFFYLDTGSCELLSSGIYNSTDTIPSASWPSHTYISQISGWHHFRYKASTSVTYTFPAGTYGFRVRTSFIDQSYSPYIAELHLLINDTLAQRVYSPQKTNSRYLISSAWIYTTDHFDYIDEKAVITVWRSDTLFDYNFGNTARSKYIGFRQMVILLARCVAGCTSCTNLHDCSSCEIGTYLNNVTKLCDSQCPRGMFISMSIINFCEICDPKCLQCVNDSVTCEQCTDTGTYSAFLLNSTCYEVCPNNFSENYDNHACQCLSGSYLDTGVCYPCHVFCEVCTGGLATDCGSCNVGFYLNNGTSTCSRQCPIGEYEYWIEELSECYLCDSRCYECENSSSICISCAFPSSTPLTRTYLTSDHQCVALCPDGYQGNNSTFICDQCLLGMYSFENVCYSQCPHYWKEKDNIRACTLPEGYPLNMTMSISSFDTVKLEIELPLGIRSDWLALLNSTQWKDYMRLQFVDETENVLILQRYTNDRLLQQSVSNIVSLKQITLTPEDFPTKLTVTTNQVSVYQFTGTHSFKLSFSDNLFCPRNIMYAIRSQQSTDNEPWIITQYYELNLLPLFLIGIFLGFACLILLLMRLQNIHRILVDYLHCLQLIGLMLFSMYPHTSSISIYSFLLGIDYTNFSFIYNVPSKIIQPCQNSCVTLTSFAYVNGDMNWLRLSGSMLQCALVLVAIALFMCIFNCSRNYAVFGLKLLADFIIVKAIHSWFASLVFAILNFSYNITTDDYFHFGMHVIGYFLLAPIICLKVNQQVYENRHIDISLIFLVIFIILEVLLSLAPMPICLLLIFSTLVEWFIAYFTGVDDNGRQIKIETNNQVTNKVDFDKQSDYDQLNIGKMFKQQPNTDIKIDINQSMNNSVQNRQKLKTSFTDNSDKVDEITKQGDVNKAAVEKSPMATRFHFHLFHVIRPITALLITSIIMIENTIITVILVSCVLTILLILIGVDLYLLNYYKQSQPVPDKANDNPKNAVQRQNSNQIRNQTVFWAKIPENIKKIDLTEQNIEIQNKGIQDKNYMHSLEAVDDQDLISNKFRDMNPVPIRRRKGLTIDDI